jgi:hypothetical protein
MTQNITIFKLFKSRNKITYKISNCLIYNCLFIHDDDKWRYVNEQK